MQDTEDKHSGQFWIDDFNIDPDGLVLHGPMGEVALEPKVMQVLVTLAKNPGQVVSRDEFMDKVWAVEYGSDESLTRAISVLRKNFGDAHGRRAIIETVPRKGYKLIGTVSKDGPLSQEIQEGSLPLAVTVPEHSDDRRRKGVFAGLIAVVLIVAAFVGYFVLSAGNKQTPTETNVGASVGKTEQISIAVLPFDDISRDKDQEYFARGISEELLNVLAKTKGLRVTSRTSAFAFKDQGIPIAQIAKELDVGHILVGSVRKSGETLRISAQLIDTSSDVHLWTETYDRPLTIDNIFDIQDEIAAAIVKALKGQLTITPEASNRPVSLEAFELYIKARDDHNKRLPDPLKAAEAGFKQVIDLDPNFAPAYSGLADTYLLMEDYAGLDRKEAIGKAAPMVARALELAPDAAEALTSASFVERTKSAPDMKKVEDLARRAIAANPNYATAHHRLGGALDSQGRNKEALAAFQTARKIDPFSAVIMTNIVSTQITLTRFDAARSVAEELVRLHPESQFGPNRLSAIETRTGNYAQALIHAKDAYAINPAVDNGQISDIYHIVGLPDHALLFANDPYRKALHAISQDDQKKARQYMAELLQWQQAYLHYRMRDFEAALPLMIAAVEQQSFLDRPIENENVGSIILKLAYYSREAGEPTAQYIKQLAPYYTDVPPADISDGLALRNRAKFEILKGEPEKAYAWIDRYQALGFVTETFSEPFYDDIRDSPEFQKRLALNETLRAGYRKEIEAQLANPKPNWKLPEE